MGEKGRRLARQAVTPQGASPRVAEHGQAPGARDGHVQEAPVLLRVGAEPGGVEGKQPALDAGDQEQAEKLRVGVEGALRQAREILEALQSEP